MIVPEKITIGGIEVKIIQSETLMKESRRVGCSDYEKQEITIDSTITGKDIFLQTFVHEVTHFILYVMGKQDLRRDEEFVDGFAHLAYQIMKQAIAEKENN